MAVMNKDSWTDDRLDDLNSKVGKVDERVQAGFADSRGDIRAIRTETRDEFRAIRTETRDEFRAVRTEVGDEFRALRADMNQQFEAVRGENAAQMRLMVQLFATMMVGILGTIATVIVKG
jgi:hypothetical protein